MDITQLLPLLGGDEKTASLLKAAGGGDKSSLLTSLLGGSNPEMAKIMGLMSMMEKEKPKNSPGLKAVTGIATNEILGLLYKLLK